VLDDLTAVTTHGYNNRDPATRVAVPDWRDDTWVYDAAWARGGSGGGSSTGAAGSGGGVANGRGGGGGRVGGGPANVGGSLLRRRGGGEGGGGDASAGGPWRAVQPHGGPPLARYGHAFVRLGDALYLFGGDDGGHTGTLSGGYVWGAYNNDVWRLSVEGGVPAACDGAAACPHLAWHWQQVTVPPAADATPSPRSLHSCVAVPMHMVAGAAVARTEVALCLGGLVSAAAAAAAAPPAANTSNPAAAQPKSTWDDPDGVAGGTVLQDTHEAWLFTVTSGATAVEPTGRWVRWPAADLAPVASPAGGDNASGSPPQQPPVAPHVRHGAGLAYFPRAVSQMPDGGDATLVEHGVYLVGGAATACDAALLGEQGLVEGTDVDVTRRRIVRTVRGEDGVAAEVATERVACQFGDTWRLVWLERIAPDGASGCAGDGLRFGADGSAPVVPRHAVWQRLVFHDGNQPGVGGVTSYEAPSHSGYVGGGAVAGSSTSDVEGGPLAAPVVAPPALVPPPAAHAPPPGGVLSAASAWLADRLAAAGWQAGSMPSPRTLPALVAVRDGLLLHGGALCNPGCQCYGDTWRLLVSPAASAASVAAPGARGGAILASSVAVAWAREAVDRKRLVLHVPRGPIHAEQDGATALWLSSAVPTSRNTSSVRLAAGTEEPPPRYRAAMASNYRPLLTRAFLDAGCALDDATDSARARTVALLFGGEAYMPSTYYDDTWLWVDATDDGAGHGGARSGSSAGSGGGGGTGGGGGVVSGGGEGAVSEESGDGGDGGEAATGGSRSGRGAARSRRAGYAPNAILVLPDDGSGGILAGHALVVAGVIILAACALMGARLRTLVTARNPTGRAAQHAHNNSKRTR